MGGIKKIDVTEANRMRKDGLTLQEIADVYGTSRQAVQQALARYTIPRGTSKGIFNQCIYPNIGDWLRIRGYTYGRFAHRLEMKPDAVYQILTGRRKPTQKFIDAVVELTEMSEGTALYTNE